MIIIIAEEGKKLKLGRIGENEARAVRFDISRIQAEFPGATFSVLNMRPEDPDAYPVNGQYIRIEGNYLYWTLQSGDLTEDGLGQCEIKATLGGAIVKEVIWTTDICPALDGNGTPPEPWESWQQQVEEDADRAEDAAEDSEAWAVGERGGEPVPEGDETYHNNAKYYAEQAEERLASKADKVSGATNNHLAALDATGNLKDSGYNGGDFANKQDTVLTTTLSRGRDATSQVGTGSLAFGDRVKATAPYSKAVGTLTEASGMNAAAEGYASKAAGQNSHAEGFHTRANNKDQHVFGAFNAPDPSTAPAGSQGRFIEIVGNGGGESNRSNARTLDWQGNERLKGDLYVGADADGTGGSKVAKVTDIPEPVDISGKADKVIGGTADNFAGLDAEGNLKDSGHKASDFLTEHQDISGKADKVNGGTADNLAALDGNGNLKDAGTSASALVESISQKADIIHDTVVNVPVASIPDGASNRLLTALLIAIDPIQTGSGDPYPGGGGKNKLPLIVQSMKDANTSGTWSGNEYTISGVKFTINLDSLNNVVGITVNGKNETGGNIAFTVYSSIPVESGTQYILNGCPSGGGNSTYALQAGGYGNDNGSGYSITASGSTITNVRILIRDGYTASSLQFKPMIRLSSVSDNTFAPYSNIRPISGRASAVVSQSGVNLFDKTIGYTNGVRNDYGQQGSSTSSAYTDPIGGLMPNTKYTLNGAFASSGGNWRVYFLDKDKEWIRRTSALTYDVVPYTFTTPENCRFIQIQFIKAAVDFNSIMLEKGETAHAYTPYVGSSHPVSFGQTVFGGEVDWVNRVLKVTHIKYVCDSVSSTATASTGIRYGQTTLSIPTLSEPNLTDSNCKSSIYKFRKTTAPSDSGWFRINATVTLYIFDDRFTDKATANAILAEELPEFWYPLATPVTVPLADLDIIRTAQTAGENNFWSDAGNIVKIEYPADTKLYIDKKLAELTALVLET